jgi:hypothetical protein
MLFIMIKKPPSRIDLLIYEFNSRLLYKLYSAGAVSMARKIVIQNKRSDGSDDRATALKL